MLAIGGAGPTAYAQTCMTLSYSFQPDCYTLFATATELYYRSGPAAAEALKRSDTARPLVRRLLRPVSEAAEALAAPRL